MAYIKVFWPESQKYMTDEMYEAGVEFGEDAGELFVPEELIY